MLQCVAVCCSVLKCAALHKRNNPSLRSSFSHTKTRTTQCVAACCSALQRVTGCSLWLGNIPISRIVVSQSISLLQHAATVQGHGSYSCQPKRTHRLRFAGKSIQTLETSRLGLLSTIIRRSEQSYQESDIHEKITLAT